jgi:hypothetical protein
MRPLPLLSLLSLLSLLGSTAACRTVPAGSEPTAQAPDASAAQAPEPTTVSVRNLRFASYTVYALHGTQRLRLGVVHGTETQTFTLPAHLVRSGQPVRFLLDPIGSEHERATEDSLPVREGDALELTIR